MTTNHTELCERLRQASIQCSDCGMYETSSDFDLAVSMIESQAARIAELEKERDGLKADAERYRWLRDFGKDGVNLKPPCEHVHTLLYSHPVGVIPASRVITGDELDRAIDAALQAEKEPRS